MRTNNNTSFINNDIRKYDTNEQQDIVNVFSPTANVVNKIQFKKENSTKNTSMKKEMNLTYNEKQSNVKIDMNNITKMENTKLDNFNNFDMFSPPNKIEDTYSLKKPENYSNRVYRTNDKPINNLNKNSNLNKQNDVYVERNTMGKQQYNSNQVNFNYGDIFYDKMTDNNNNLIQRNNEEIENNNFYEQRLNNIKVDSETNDKKSKSLNYNLINKSTKSIENSGLKRKEQLENIKDYLGKIEKTTNKTTESDNISYIQKTINNQKNFDPENQRMKLNEVSKKFLMEKMQELTHKQPLCDPHKVIPQNGLNYRKHINSQFIYKK